VTARRKYSLRTSSDIVILLVGLGLTFLAFKITNGLVVSNRNTQFSARVNRIETITDSTIKGYVNILAGMKGFFSASTEVTRDDFRIYIESLNTPNLYPGIYGFAYISRVSEGDKDLFLDKLKVELNERNIILDTSIQLADNPEHYIVNYVVTVKKDIPHIPHGYDMKSDKIRGIFLDTAAEKGEPVSSELISVMGPETPGFIMTIPIYKNGMPSDTPNERKEALVGFVNIAIEHQELFKNILTPTLLGNTQVTVKDGGETIYKSSSAKKEEDNRINYEVRNISVAGRNWEVEVFTASDSLAGIESSLPLIVLISGSVVSFLSFGLAFALSSSRKRAELLVEKTTSDLKSEKDRINLIISSMGEGLLVVDKGKKLTMMNPAAEALLEITEKEARGKDWSQIVSTLKEDIKTPTSERSFSKTIDEDKVIVTHLDHNHYYLTRGGRKFPIVSITAPLKQEGKMTGAVKVFRDATHEKELEEELRKERDQANLIISSMGEGLMVIDGEYKVVLMNSKAEKLLETDLKEAQGMKWSDIVKAYDKDKIIPFDNRVSVKVLKTGKAYVTKIDDNHYYKTHSGKKFSVASITAPLFGEDGEIVGAVKVFRDSTAEKDAKALIEKKVEERTRDLKKAKDKISEGWYQLQGEKARLTASINSLPLGFFIVTREHEIVYMNPTMQTILGKTNNKWTFASLRKRFGESKIELKSFCAHCRGQASAHGMDGVPFDSRILRIISVPITLPEKNEVLGSAILIEDVTEAKLLERSKDEFFAVASHELRTPLTAIRGNTSLIMEYFWKKIEDKEVREMLSDMHESSVRLIDIVNDFLDVSRLEQGKIEFKKEKIDISEIVHDSLVELKVKAEDKGLKVEEFLPKERIPNALADKNRTTQIILNLLGNAINYTQKGGVKIKILKNGEFIKISISDTGVGITEKNKKLLFKKFQQAGERVLARDVTRGTGMGLYISKLLVEGMGGKIYLEESNAGKGSTFAFELPIAK